MPFTFAHPAIVLPIHRIFKNRLSLTGLVIGSMLPDAEYFIRMKIMSEVSHSMIGVFLLNWMLGLILFYVFHSIVKKPFIEYAPMFIKSRLVGYRHDGAMDFLKKNVAIVIISLIIGAMTHVVWDSFTHEGGFFVNTFPILQSNINIGEIKVPILKFLQHGSTLLGLSYLTLVFLNQKICHAEVNPRRGIYIFSIACLSIGLLLLRMQMRDIQWIQYGHVLVSLIACTLLSIFFVSGMKNYIYKTKRH